MTPGIRVWNGRNDGLLVNPRGNGHALHHDGQPLHPDRAWSERFHVHDDGDGHRWVNAHRDPLNCVPAHPGASENVNEYGDFFDHHDHCENENPCWLAPSRKTKSPVCKNVAELRVREKPTG